MKNKKHDKLAVFDLDETLYDKNSHIEVVSGYYRIRFDSIPFKVFGRLVPNLYVYLLTWLYKHIPLSFIQSFDLEFKDNALLLLEDKIKEGFYPVIISNAPIELIEVAANKLSLDFYRAEVGKKSEVVKDFSYDLLCVCTDNVTDKDILLMADEKYIFIKSDERKKYFKDVQKAKFMRG